MREIGINEDLPANDKITAETIIGFHKPEEPYGVFSNWYMSDFIYAGEKYNCVEQYMMSHKVMLAMRFDLENAIMLETDPGKMKGYAGKEAFPEFDKCRTLWGRTKVHMIKQAVKAKFRQDAKGLEMLFGTGNALLCECAGRDLEWGIGINLHNDAWKNVSNWRGRNYLGRILMEVREELRTELMTRGTVEYVDYADAGPIAEWKMMIGQLERIPQYYNAVHTYAERFDDHDRGFLYTATFEGCEHDMQYNMGGGLPIWGFYEMKQEIYEIAARLNCLQKV